MIKKKNINHIKTLPLPLKKKKSTNNERQDPVEPFPLNSVGLVYEYRVVATLLCTNDNLLPIRLGVSSLR